MKTKVRKVTSPRNPLSADRPSIWETIDHIFGDIPIGHWHSQTDRLAVPGGWLYRCREWCNETDSAVANVGNVAMVFVPSRGRR